MGNSLMMRPQADPSTKIQFRVADNGVSLWIESSSGRSDVVVMTPEQATILAIAIVQKHGNKERGIVHEQRKEA